jgi:hypothetical protein
MKRREPIRLELEKRLQEAKLERYEKTLREVAEFNRKLKSTESLKEKKQP